MHSDYDTILQFLWTEPISIHTLLTNKRQGPGKYIHEVWKPVRMRGAVELPDIHNIVLVFQYCS